MAAGLRFKFEGVTIPDDQRDRVLSHIQAHVPVVDRMIVTETAVYVGTHAQHQPSRIVPKRRIRNGKMTSGFGTRRIEPDGILEDKIGFHLREALGSLDNDLH